MKVSIILVNYNNADDTIRCVESLLKHTNNLDTSVHITVVDNHSSDGNTQSLQSIRNSKVTLLEASKNRGYAAGNNLGIKHALKNENPDWIWLLNNDTTIEAKTLPTLLSAVKKDPKIKIWGSTIRGMKEPKKVECHAGFRYISFLSYPHPIKAQKNKSTHKIRALDFVSGVSQFVHAEVLKEKQLDERYFLYYEEIDFVRKIGGKKYLGWAKGSTVYHLGGGSTGSQNPNKNKGSEVAHYYGNLSALKYHWKYHKITFLFTACIRFGAKNLIFLMNRDWSASRSLWKAYRDFLSS